MKPETENKISTPKKSPKRSVRKVASKKAAPAEKIVLVKKDSVSEQSSIARSVSIACVVMTVVVLTISPSAVWILGPVIGAMAIFGIAMGYFASK